ncbi:MAG: DSD1 family PLP-dependent enzyme [Candidatus Bathyarchaeia archaeon]
MDKRDIATPALLLDFDAFQSNIRMMADYLRDKPVKLRPHAKCHKTPIIAYMQIRAGAKGVTVAKLGEAEVMAKAGISDIYIANQVVQESKMEKLVNLNQYSNVSVAVDNPDVVERLSKIASGKKVDVKVIEEIDVGLNRCGVQPGKPAVDLAKKISRSKGLIFEGVMGWEGHSAFVKDLEERKKECHECYRKTVETVKEIRKIGIDVNTVGAGGTTSFSIAAEYPGINEIQPGSYIFMSLLHSLEGVPFKYSLTVLTTVVSRQAKDRAVIDGGVQTFSTFGGYPKAKGLEGVEIHDLHMEHGLLRLKDPNIKLKPGDTIEFIPYYPDTAINLHDRLYVMKGDAVMDIWKIGARGRVD